MSSSKIKPCSLTSVNLNDISIHDDGVVSHSFQLQTLLQSYKRYASDLDGEEDHKNFYIFVAEKHKCIPNFFGYNQIPSWPLDEEWSKWMLFLYIPHDGTGIESMKLNGTFRERMEIELTNEHFPVSILSKVMRVKNRTTFCVQLHNEVLPPGSNHTLVSDRTNEQFDEAITAADDNQNDEEMYEDTDDGDFGNVQFPPHLPGIWWDLKYDPNGEIFLEDFQKRCYENGVDIVNMPVQLFKEDIYRPENVGTHKQMLNVDAFLLKLKDVVENTCLYCDQGGIRRTKLKLTRFYVQWNPGTGKSFVIHTLSNIMAKVF